MERDQATELLNEWHELPKPTEADGLSNALFRAVMSLLPTDINAAGAAVVDGAPSVVALDAQSVFVVSVVEQAEGTPRAEARRFPLAAENVVVRVVDDTRGEAREGVSAHVRDWDYRWPGGDGFALRTVVKVYDAWNDAPVSGEHFAHSLCARLDWKLPVA